LSLVARHAVDTIHVTVASILVVENDELVVRAAYPRRVLGRDLDLGHRVALSAYPVCDRVMEQNDPKVVRASDLALTDLERKDLFLGICQTVCVVPLQTDNRSLGLVVLGEERSEEREPFTAEKIRLARSIGDQAASALHRAELFSELEQSYLQTVLTLANAVEAKDSYTGDHIQNVARMALDVGREMGLDQRELESLRFGAVLHDIGKIGIPDSILKKPTALDAEEWKIMRQHPVIGEQIISPIRHLREASLLVRYHHERFDGKGYPDGLAGEAIPRGARILSVVDSYSAIIDQRVYKRGRSHEEAVAELSRCAGAQFDPDVVQVFLRQLAVQARSQPEPQLVTSI
jgi:HD-GYP domain-containing protein (c-di-GMP phosphodiesterase class II)